MKRTIFSLFMIAMLAAPLIAASKYDSRYAPLICAAMDGDVQAVTELLARKNVDINQEYRPDEGDTALVFAVSNNHESVVRLLLADPRIDLSKNGSRALSFAVYFDLATIVELLLAAPGIGIDLRNRKDRATLLGHARLCKSAKVLALLKTHGVYASCC